MDINSLRADLMEVQNSHFNIINCYIMGTVKIEDVNSFERLLNVFKNKVYGFRVSDENIMEIAKMKSLIQHYNTEVLEDEELLKVAYHNSNGYIEKL